MGGKEEDAPIADLPGLTLDRGWAEASRRLDRFAYPIILRRLADLCATWLGHVSINDRGCLVQQWTWRTRTGSAPPRLPTSRGKPRFLWVTSITTSRPKTRLARRSSS